MLKDIKEADWKKYRVVHKAALERFCDKVLSEIQYFAGERERSSHERYLEIYKRIKERDKELSGLFDPMKRSTAVFQLAGLRYHKLVSDDGFARFSEELRESVEYILSPGRK